MILPAIGLALVAVGWWYSTVNAVELGLWRARGGDLSGPAPMVFWKMNGAGLVVAAGAVVLLYA